jgi:hypothetical protein
LIKLRLSRLNKILENKIVQPMNSINDKSKNQVKTNDSSKKKSNVLEDKQHIALRSRHRSDIILI